MADERKAPGESTSQPLAPTMARLLAAEDEADEIVKRAQKEAEEIVAKAKARAKEILDTARAGDESTDASRARVEAEKQKGLIINDARRRIEAMRSAAAARLAEAVQKLVALLVAES